MIEIDPRRLTQVVVVVAFLLLGAYDIAMILLCGPHASISAVVSELTQRFPIIAVVCAAVVGHMMPLAAVAVGVPIGFLFWPVFGGK